MDGRALFAVIITLASVIATACATPLDDLTPFPCAADRTCPAGLACIANATCVVPRFDAPCQEGRTDCRRAGPTGTCSYGVCGEQCSEKEPCPAGRQCTVEPGRGAGACVLDCASGAACPEGLVCRDLGYQSLEGCVALGNVTSIGSPCTKNEDCANAGAAAQCASGVCSLPCDKADQCPAGTVCSTPEGSVTGTCLRDCGVDRVCSVGTTCRPLWRDGKFACFGGENRVRACKAVEVSFTCSRACGTKLVLGRVACSDGTFCTAGASCAKGGSCDCNDDSRAVTCEGQPCNGANCASGDSWWCAPQGEGNVGCDDDLSRFGATCSCWDGTTRTVGCGMSATCEQLCADECNVITQNCPPGSRPKCTEITNADRTSRRICMEVTGQRLPGETCRRIPGGPPSGADDCAIGSFCSVAATSPLDYRCRAFCDVNTPCAANEACVAGSRFDRESDASICRPICELFGTASCPTGLSCKLAFSDGRGYCSAACTVSAGGACFTSSECAGRMFCVAGGYCGEPCDEAHPCEGGAKCSAEPGRVGVCAVD